MGSVYSFASRCRELKKWCDTHVHHKGREKLRRLYTRGATASGARGCTKESLLHVDDRHHFVAMCVLHLLIAVGKYITKFFRVHATRLAPHQRNKAQELLNMAETNKALKGKSQPDGEEVWRLLTNWSVIAKVMNLPSQARAVVEQMFIFLTLMYRWVFHPGVLEPAGVATPFQRIICPTVRSPYLLWLRKDAKRVFNSIRPWGAAMFCGYIVETINTIHKDDFLGKSARGGGGRDVDGNDERLLNHAHERAFL